MKLADLLAQKNGISRTALMEIMIRDRARSEGIKLEQAEDLKMNNKYLLSEKDNKILNDTLLEFGITIKVSLWFSANEEGKRVIHLDGYLTLLEMKAFTEAMSRMEKQHTLES